MANSDAQESKRPRKATKRRSTRKAGDDAQTPAPEAPSSNAGSAKKNTRKASRKATKKATKPKAKKAPGAQRAAKPQPTAKVTPLARRAADFNRDTVSGKIRVHLLAKKLEATSRELIVALDEIGLVKVAQSSLSVDEVNRLVDHLAAPAIVADQPQESAEQQPEEAGQSEPAGKEAAPKKSRKSARKQPKKSAATQAAEREQAKADQPESEDGAAPADAAEPAEPTEQPAASRRRRSAKRSARRPAGGKQPEAEKEAGAKQQSGRAASDDKLRQRVEKNVANEIHQIEEKVERELSALEDASPEFVAAVEAEQGASLLEDVASEVTPAPKGEQEQANEEARPLFMAPVFQAAEEAASETAAQAEPQQDDAEDEAEEDVDTREGASSSGSGRRRRRGRRGSGRGRGGKDRHEREEDREPEELPDEPVALKGSTRLEAQRRRRSERREEGRRKRHVVSEAEFLARRESVERIMVVREKDRSDEHGVVTQVGVLEDEMLVEHFVTSSAQPSLVGNVYLGRVQNVLPSMEAAFIDIGKGRNAVLYAGEVDWRSAGLGGRNRRIEQALHSGDQVLVQVTKDPVGHKGARLTTQISLAGRFLVYVPGGRSAGISRKLPEPERKRLKGILKEVVPGRSGVIIRTAAEGVHEKEIEADVNRLHHLWEEIQERTKEEKSSKGAKPVTLYEEPDVLVKVVRDLFNEDFTRLVVDGDRAWSTVHAYVHSVAPDLEERLERYDRADHNGKDAFQHYRIDEQLQKALSRKVWLPSGGTLVIDRTEAMTVIDVNTGKFTGAGGNLEETVTRNNLEAAEEIVRQMRLRDIGGMIVVDFIDMVLPENRDLVLRRLKEFLGRDRTRHQVSELTSLGLVQMTRKKLGTGLLETFATVCEACEGTGYIVHEDPVEETEDRPRYGKNHRQKSRKRNPEHDPAQHPAALAMHRKDEEPKADDGKSIEELADAVIGNVADEHAVEERGDAAQDSSGKEAGAESGSRRSRGSRGSRGARRGARRSARKATSAKQGADDAARTSAADVANIAAEAVAQADAADPEEPSGADHLPEQTFEEAQAAFEASPRRKRATRGNSRSDKAPRKEDFEPSKPVDPVEPAKPTREEKDTKDTPAEDNGTEQHRGRRGRRKARRSNRAQSGAAAPVEPKNEKAQPASDAQAEAGEPEGQPDGSAPRRRGRRRAVRKATRKATASQPKEAPQSPDAPAEEPVDRREAPQRKRGAAGGRRRRSARRSGSSKRG